MKTLVKISLLLLMLLYTIGCQWQPEKKPNQEQEPPQKEKSVQVDLSLAEKVKEAVKSVPGVEEATSVVMQDNISTAVKVSGFNRLRLKSIKEEVHQKIRELNQDYQVYVTSDKKLYKLLQDIEKDLTKKRQKTAPESVYKKIEKINEDMKG